MNARSVILSVFAVLTHSAPAQVCFNSIEELDATLDLYYQGGWNAAIQDVYADPGSYQFVNKSTYDSAYSQRYDEGLLAGESFGRQQVQSDPSSYGLYTKSQYDANRAAGWSDGYAKGVAAGIQQVLGSPSSHSLYTESQFNQNRLNGRSDVTANPAAYGLVAAGALSNEIHQAMEQLVRALAATGSSPIESESIASGMLRHGGDGVFDELIPTTGQLANGRMLHLEFDIEALRTSLSESGDISSTALLLDLSNPSDESVELHWYPRDGDGVVDQADAWELSGGGGTAAMVEFTPNPAVDAETAVDVKDIIAQHSGGEVRLILHQLAGEYEYFAFRTGVANSPFLEITTDAGVQRVDPLRKGSYFIYSFFGDTDQGFDFVNQVTASGDPMMQSWGIIDFDLGSFAESAIQSAVLKLYSSGGSFDPSVGIVATSDTDAVPEALSDSQFQPPSPSEILELGGDHDGLAVLSSASLTSAIREALTAGKTHVGVSLVNLSGQNITIGVPDGHQSTAVLLANSIDIGSKIDEAVAAGEELVRNQPGEYGLLREDEILEQQSAGLVMKLTENVVRLRLPIQISDDLAGWQDSGMSLEADLPVDTEIKKRFYRLRLAPAADGQ